MVSTYNDTLFTTAAAKFFATSPTETAAEAVQQLMKIWQRFH